jgi:hypothetical protein
LEKIKYIPYQSIKGPTMSQSTYVDEVHAITDIIQHYIDGARTGKGAAMKPAFHEGATIYGYVGPDLFGGPIQGLFDWNDTNGAAKDINTKISSVDVVGTCANVRVDSDNWTGHRFTDFFNLVKFDGHWKIVSKVFYLHP